MFIIYSNAKKNLTSLLWQYEDQHERYWNRNHVLNILPNAILTKFLSYVYFKNVCPVCLFQLKAKYHLLRIQITQHMKPLEPKQKQYNNDHRQPVFVWPSHNLHIISTRTTSLFSTASHGILQGAPLGWETRWRFSCHKCSGCRIPPVDFYWTFGWFPPKLWLQPWYSKWTFDSTVDGCRVVESYIFVQKNSVAMLTEKMFLYERHVDECLYISTLGSHW